MLGLITGFDRDSHTLAIAVPDFYDEELLQRQDISECDVVLQDGRTITPRQNRAIHAMCRDISSYISGYADKEAVRNETLRTLQMAYLIDTESKEQVRFALTNWYCELCGIEIFSLSARSPNAASVSLASGFLTWLIDFALENAIPCSASLLDRAEDIGRYLYACIANRRCAICGKPADLHHSTNIGMGRDRKSIIHVGMEAQPLCREHHTEAHTSGQQTFDAKYHLQSIRLDENLCNILGLKTEAD